MPLKLKRYPKRSPYWCIRGTVRGQAIFETAGTDDRAAAEAIRIKREGELLNRSIFGTGTTVSFIEAAVSYLDEGGEARFLGKFDEATGKWSLLIGHFATTPIAGIGQAEIDDAAKKLYSKASAATLKRQVYVPMAAVLNHAAAKKWIGAPRLRHPRVAKPETKFSTPERLAKLLPHCSPKLRRLGGFSHLYWRADLRVHSFGLGPRCGAFAAHGYALPDKERQAAHGASARSGVGRSC